MFNKVNAGTSPVTNSHFDSQTQMQAPNQHASVPDATLRSQPVTDQTVQKIPNVKKKSKIPEIKQPRSGSSINFKWVLITAVFVVLLAAGVIVLHAYLSKNPGITVTKTQDITSTSGHSSASDSAISTTLQLAADAVSKTPDLSPYGILIDDVRVDFSYFPDFELNRDSLTATYYRGAGCSWENSDTSISLFVGWSSEGYSAPVNAEEFINSTDFDHSADFTAFDVVLGDVWNGYCFYVPYTNTDGSVQFMSGVNLYNASEGLWLALNTSSYSSQPNISYMLETLKITTPCGTNTTLKAVQGTDAYSFPFEGSAAPESSYSPNYSQKPTERDNAGTENQQPQSDYYDENGQSVFE